MEMGQFPLPITPAVLVRHIWLHLGSHQNPTTGGDPMTGLPWMWSSTGGDGGGRDILPLAEEDPGSSSWPYDGMRHMLKFMFPPGGSDRALSGEDSDDDDV